LQNPKPFFFSFFKLAFFFSFFFMVLLMWIIVNGSLELIINNDLMVFSNV
jgi:hypothetical protein